MSLFWKCCLLGKFKELTSRRNYKAKSPILILRKKILALGKLFLKTSKFLLVRIVSHFGSVVKRIFFTQFFVLFTRAMQRGTFFVQLFLLVNQQRA